LGAAKPDVGFVFGRIGLGAERRPQPVGRVDVGAAPLHLRGPLERAPRIDGGIRRVERVVVPVRHPFVQIASQIVGAIGAAPMGGRAGDLV
jgi:hypothetical protein